MSIDAPPVGRQLGDYILLDKIAEGGMGAVYRGRKASGGPVVAVKVLPVETARNQLLMKRFEQEFRAAAMIDHPNVVKALDYSGTLPVPFLVMEYVEGTSLGELVEKQGRLSETDAVYVLGQVCDGLHAAHKQGLIHRDVKPDNVLVTKALLTKLTDLGLVRDVESDDNLTRTGKGLGTPHYMAPEQFRNAKHVDVRSDVYSLGATLYMAVTGVVPFAKCSPLDCWMKKTKDDLPPAKALAPHLSDRVNFAIRRAMKANPSERQTSCREFMEDLLGEAWRAAAASGTRLLAPPQDDLWYMVFYDCGFPKTVKGGTDTIRQNIRAGVLGDLSVILVSRTKAGPFSPLRSVPEFRDLMLAGYALSGTADPSTVTGMASPTPSSLPPAPLASSVTGQTPLNRDLEPRSAAGNTPLPSAIRRRLDLSDSDATPPTDEFDSIPVVEQEGLPSRRSARLSARRPKPVALQSKPTPEPAAEQEGAAWGWWVAAAAVGLALACGLAVGLMFRG